MNPMHCARIAVPLFVALVLGAAAASAGPPNTRIYCISGSGNGTSWDWEVRDQGTTMVQHGETGLSVIGTNVDVRNAFVVSVRKQGNSSPYVTAAKITPTPSACASASDAAFSISAQNPFDLWVQALATGSLTIVGPSPLGTVTFNPDIYLPEPGALTMLTVGWVVLLGLGRARTRR